MCSRRALRGRAFAARRRIALVGVLAGLCDPRHVVAACGAALARYCLARFGNRALLRVGDRGWVEGVAARRGEGYRR